MAEQMSIQGIRPTSSDMKVKQWQTLGFGLFIHFVDIILFLRFCLVCDK